MYVVLGFYRKYRKHRRDYTHTQTLFNETLIVMVTWKTDLSIETNVKIKLVPTVNYTSLVIRTKL